MSTGYGAAAQFAGAMMQAVAANQEQRSMFNEYQDELQRQGVLGAEAMGQQWDPGVRQWGNAQQDLGAATQRREGVYNNLNQRSLVANQAGPDAKAQAILGQNAGARAKLDSYGDWMNQQGLNMQHTQQGLDKISNFSRGDASVFPYRMWNAQHSQDELSFWGQLIQSAGGGASSFGQQGGPPQQAMGGGGGAFSGGPNYQGGSPYGYQGPGGTPGSPEANIIPYY